MVSGTNTGDAQQLAPATRVLAGAVLALANFMVVIDLTIANASIPNIAGNLSITREEGTWVITSYAVAEAISVPLTGWLARRFGPVRVFLFSMSGFGLFSLICGLAPSLGLLVARRIGQGLCGGPIMPMSQTLMTPVFPAEQQPAALGAWLATVMMEPAFGPILGGMIGDSLTWHWIFLINVPIAAGCALAGQWLLRGAETPAQRVPLDSIGLCLLIFWIACLQIMLDIGRDRDWFEDATIVTLAVMALVGFICFVAWELGEEHPIVDLRVFRHRGFTVSVGVLSLCFGAFFSSIVVVPQWLQTTMGYTATRAGVVTSIHAYAGLLSGQIVSRFAHRVDPRLIASIGVTWIGMIALMRSHWTSGSDFPSLLLPMFLQGFGVPMMMVPLTTIALRMVQHEETASAAGLQNFARTMAIAVATSAVMTIWSNDQQVSRSEILDELRPQAALTAFSDAGLSETQSLRALSMLVDREAVTLAAAHTFQIAAVVMFLSAVLVWLSPKPKTNLPAPDTVAH